ncbi:MAG: hypothetical protein ACYTBS_09775, partial [Planctomycetota bacterium]
MKSTEKIEQSIKQLTVESGDRIHDRILDKLLRKMDEMKRKTSDAQTRVWTVVTPSSVGKLAAACLIFASGLTCLVLARKVGELKRELALARQDVAIAQQDIPPTRPDDTTTINLYLKEHQDVVARHASFSSATRQPVQIRVDQDDVLYYEPFDSGSEFMHPGIIVMAPSPRREIRPSEAP